MKQLCFFVLILILTVGCAGNEQPTAVPQPTVVSQPTTSAQLPDTAVPTPTLAQSAPTTAVQPTEPPPPAPTTAAATPVSLPSATAGPTSAAVPIPGADAIHIQEPGPGWRLTSPIHVTGMADPTFEQNLVVRLLLDDGTELALTPVTIAADVGQRGPFAVDIPFTISGERQAFLQIYATSARDGGITHLSSVGFTIADSGPENRPSFTPMNERIVISQPLFNTVVSGGVVHVSGVAVASFEATLVIEILDESGAVIGSAPVLVQSSDLGLPGVFEADISYSGAPTGAGRVVVRDISPAFGGDVHVASVEIQFE